MFKFNVSKIFKVVMSMSICLGLGFTQIALAEEQEDDVTTLYDVIVEYDELIDNDQKYFVRFLNRLNGGYLNVSYDSAAGYKKFYDFTKSVPLTKIEPEIIEHGSWNQSFKRGPSIVFEKYSERESKDGFLEITQTGELYVHKFVSEKGYPGGRTTTTYKEYKVQDFDTFIEIYNDAFKCEIWKDSYKGVEGWEYWQYYNGSPEKYTMWAQNTLRRGVFQWGGLHGDLVDESSSDGKQVVQRIAGDYTVPVTREDFAGFLYVAMLNAEITRAEEDIRINKIEDNWDRYNQNHGGEIMEDGKIRYHSFNGDAFDQGLEKLSEMKIILGNEHGDLKPKDKITREEAAVVMSRAYAHYEELPDIDTDQLPASKISTFNDDSEIGDWAKESVYALRKLEIMKGYTHNKFVPDGSLSIEESVGLSFSLFDSLTPCV